jgi:hypothetical protein
MPGQWPGNGSRVKDNEFQYRSGGDKNAGPLWQSAECPVAKPRSPAASPPAPQELGPPYLLRPNLLDLSSPHIALGGKKLCRSQTFCESPQRTTPSVCQPPASKSNHPEAGVWPSPESKAAVSPTKEFPTFGFYGIPARVGLSPIVETHTDHQNPLMKINQTTKANEGKSDGLLLRKEQQDFDDQSKAMISSSGPMKGQQAMPLIIDVEPIDKLI